VLAGVIVRPVSVDGRDSSQRRQSNQNSAPQLAPRPSSNLLLFYWKGKWNGPSFASFLLPKSGAFLSTSALAVRVSRDTQAPRLHGSRSTGTGTLKATVSADLVLARAQAPLLPIPIRLPTAPCRPCPRPRKMTEVVAEHQQRHHSAPTGPLTRSAMAARPAAGAAPAVAAARQHGSETSPTAPLSSSGPPRPPTPADAPSGEPPRRPITRKRAASINTEEANRPKIENLSLSTPSTAGSRPFDAGRDLICLCTPAPKVPRPRNGMSCPFQKCRSSNFHAHSLVSPTLSCHLQHLLLLC